MHTVCRFIFTLQHDYADPPSCLLVCGTGDTRQGFCPPVVQVEVEQTVAGPELCKIMKVGKHSRRVMYDDGGVLALRSCR